MPDRRLNPTVSLYFTDPLTGLVGPAKGKDRGPIRRLTPSLFDCDGTAVVIRYAGAHELALLRSGGYDKIMLVVDDDLFAVGPDDDLPGDYRKRLLDYRDGPMMALLELATDVVAPSERILVRFPGKAQHLLDPAQCHRLGALAHHRKPGGLDIVVASTRSHLVDVRHIAPALAQFLQERPDARLTTFLNGHAPKPLRGLANAQHLSNMPWFRYRGFVAENRFHVALAPALDTAFNRARSVSKIHDHAALGAAGLYSAQQPFDRVVDNGKSGMLLSNDPAAWRMALHELADRRT